MSRITNLAANTQLVNQLLRTQTRMFDLQNQVSSEKVSQDYSGISIESQRLINLENTRDSLKQYISNNDSMMTQLDITAATVEGIRVTVSDFKKALIDYKVGDPSDQNSVFDIQTNAFQSLQSMEALMNTSIDGRFIFSGARVTDQAVDFGLTDLGAYQAKFDGSTVKYPTTRDAQLSNFSISQNPAFDSKTFNSGAISMTFADANPDTVTAAAGTFRYPNGTSLPAGTTVTFTGTVSNNATYTIASISSDGSTATFIGGDAVTAETAATTTAVAETPLVFADVGTADTITGPTDTFKDASSNLLGAGTQITVTNTTSNNGTFTISSVSSDGKTATLVSTNALTNETDGSSTLAVAKQTNFLKFERADSSSQPQSRITAQGGQFANVDVGSFITISGTASNNGSYEVLSKPSNGEIIVRTEMFYDETSTSASIATADGVSVGPSTTGDLTFVRDNGDSPVRSRLTATIAGSLSDIKVGQMISINNAAAGPPTNNGTYTVLSNNGTYIDVATQMLTDEGTAATPHLSGTTLVNEVTFANNASPTKDTITASGTVDFSTLSAGMSVTISGATAAANNRVYTIDSVSADGKTITVNEEVTAAAPDVNTITVLVPFADGTISSTSYYHGDQTSMTHRVDKNRDFEFDFNAVDPAFEKAIRAMQMIAQGTFQSEGGLDQNIERITQAQYLLNSSLKRTVIGTAPFGTELTSNMEKMGIDLAINQILVHDTNKKHEGLIVFLDGSIFDIEQADPLETITRLIDDQRQMETSFQALATIRQLSLLNYL